MTMQFRHSRAGVLIFSDDVLRTFRSYLQLAVDTPESGGVLLGRLLRDDHDIVIERVTTPLPGDKRTRAGFDRGGEAHLREIEKTFAETGGAIQYVGEWHTHAEPFPTPSPMDLKAYRAAVLESVKQNEACFLVIVGQRALRVWECDRQTGVISQLENVTDGGRDA